jgi:hypothetical protein
MQKQCFIVTRYADALNFAMATSDEFDRAASMLLKRGSVKYDFPCSGEVEIALVRRERRERPWNLGHARAAACNRHDCKAQATNQAPPGLCESVIHPYILPLSRESRYPVVGLGDCLDQIGTAALRVHSAARFCLSSSGG